MKKSNLMISHGQTTHPANKPCESCKKTIKEFDKAMMKQMKKDPNNYFKGRRQRLLKKHPYCYWCGRKVREKRPTTKKFKKYHATIDHLISKYSKRIDPLFKKKTLVLACFECNNKRGQEETKKQSKFKLWWRSGSFPKRLWILQVIRNLVKRIGKRT